MRKAQMGEGEEMKVQHSGPSEDGREDVNSQWAEVMKGETKESHLEGARRTFIEREEGNWEALGESCKGMQRRRRWAARRDSTTSVVCAR